MRAVKKLFLLWLLLFLRRTSHGLLMGRNGRTCVNSIPPGEELTVKQHRSKFSTHLGRTGRESLAGSDKNIDPNDEISDPLTLMMNILSDSKRHLAAAAVARGTSMFLMFPLDTIKTRIQMGQSLPFRPEGLFSGLLGSMIGQLPYGALTFGSYEVYKSFFFQKAPQQLVDSPILVYACAAILGDLTGSFWLCPSEVIKQQMQAGMYDSMDAAMTTIWHTKGIMGFYEGYRSALLRDVPFRMFQLTSFEVTKSLFLDWKEATNRRMMVLNGEESALSTSQPTDFLNNDLDSFESAICGAAAGTFAAALTSPLDRVKTLLMTDSELYGGSIWTCMSQLLSEEGWTTFLLTGMTPRVAYIAPTVMIFFVVYEQAQQFLSKQEADA